jgi:hypothetical protein
MNKTKVCSKCKQEISIDNFYKCGKYFHSWCKSCEREYSKINSKTDKRKEQYKIQNKNYRSLPINVIAGRIRNSLKKYNSEYMNDIDHWFIAGYLIAKYNWAIKAYGLDNLDVEHIVPLSYFDLTNRNEYNKAYWYKNIRLYPKDYNRQKANHVTYPTIKVNGLECLL